LQQETPGRTLFILETALGNERSMKIVDPHETWMPALRGDKRPAAIGRHMYLATELASPQSEASDTRHLVVAETVAVDGVELGLA
jgi:hypothetical protein